MTIPLTGGDSLTCPVDPTGGDEGVTVPAYQLNNPAAEKDVKSAAAPCAGWLVCVKGRYMGRDFRLQFGKNTIGRKETNSICLSGDVGVSREPQAIVVYEPASNRFFAIPGTARELAYINGEVLLERVELHKNDVIEMGETQLMFIPCCDDKALSAITLTLHGKMQCHPRPELWAERQAELMNSACTDAGDTPWGQEILESARASAEFWSAEFDRLIGQVAGNEKIAAAYLENLETTAAGIRELLRAVKLGWDKAFECPPVEFPRLKPLRNSPDAELSERVKARRKACKSDMDGLSRLFYAPSEKLLAEIRDSAPAMTALLELTLDFDRAYCAEKRRAGYVDYSDLEHLAARLLTDESGEPTALARRLSKRYTEIMFDEYQDVSQVQDAKNAAMFELYEYGGGRFAIGFKDGVIAPSAAKLRSVSIPINIWLNGNETAKPNTTVTVRINIAK